MDNSEALSKPRNVTHTLYKLNGWINRGLIDLNPDFQRDVVWRDIKQSHLIDSIKNNFYVPPVIFSCKKIRDNEGSKTLRVCIDGKQRLTSIRRFFNNEIPHLIPDAPRNTRRFYSLESENCFTEYERENIFDCAEFVCVEYWDLNLAQEQEIFSRVQLGMPLTNAEKLASISSPTVDFAQNLYATYNSISQIIDTKRGKPLELITQTLYMIENEPEKQVFTHNNLTKYLKDDREVPIRLKQTAKTVFETLDTLIEENAAIFNENHKLAPIEFVFFCWIIAKFPRLEIWQYQMYLKEMKEHVKTYHTDIRFNAKVYATLREYVVDLEPDELVADYGSGKRSKCGFMAVESSKRIKMEH